MIFKKNKELQEIYTIIAGIKEDFFNEIDYKPAKDIIENSKITVSRSKIVNAFAYPFFHKNNENYEVEITKGLLKTIQNTCNLFSALRLNESIDDEKYRIEMVSLFKKNKRTSFESYFINQNHTFITEYQGISRNLFVCSLAFLIGHEYGHHILKHTDYKLQHVSIDPHDKEFHCDLFSYELIYRTMFVNGYIHLDAILGILITYLAIVLLKDSPYSDSDSHPSELKRYKEFSAFIDTIVLNGKESAFKEFYEVCELIDETDLVKNKKWWSF